MKITVSTVSDRRLAGVWRWYAIEHVRNHPRWDPDMELEQISEARSALESGDATATSISPSTAGLEPLRLG